MATLLPKRERSEHSARTRLRPPPSLPPRKPVSCGMGDDDPRFLQWMREQEQRWSEEANGETAFGCDYSDGPLAPGGCAW